MSKVFSSPVTGRGQAMMLCAAEDGASLAERLDEGSSWPDQPGSVRVAIVNPTGERVALARDAVARGKAWRGRMGIWFSPRPLLADGGRLAIMFPGIEASLPGRVDDVAARFRLATPTRASTRAGAVFALGWLLDAALTAVGVHADVIAGHGIGEWNGMVAAGMLGPEAAEAQVARLDPCRTGLADLVYASAGCEAGMASAAVQGIDDVVVSHDNCPHLSVLCGTRPAVTEALGRLRAARVMVAELPFVGGLHSPMFRPHLGRIRKELEALPLQPAARSLWSATTCRPYPEGADEVRALAARHLTEPVRFRELVLRLHDEGVRAFVQVGVGSLVGFVDDTLKEHDHLAVSAAASKGPGLEQLRRVAAALWVEGADVRFDRLLADAAPGPTATPLPHLRPSVRPRPAASHNRPVSIGS